MLEDQLSRFAVKFGAYGEYLPYLLFGGLLVAVIIYFVYYLSFNKIVVIKERVGQSFDFDFLMIEKEEKNQAMDDLRKELSKIQELGNKEQKGKLIKAIQTTTRTFRGKIIKKKNKYYLSLFRFLNTAQKMKLPGSMYWTMAGNKRRLELLKLSEHIYAPLVVAFDNEVYLKAHHDEDYIDWVVNDIEEDKRKYLSQSFWDRYGGAIMILATFMLCLIFVVVVFKNMNEFANAGKEGAKVLANACSSQFTQNI